MSKLVVLDASVYLHAGTFTNQSEIKRDGKGFQIYGLEVGGLHFLFRQIAKEIQMMNRIIVVFDSKTDRRESMPDYKGTRKPIAKILMQQVQAIKFLERMNIQVVKKEGYEADDLIAKVVKDNYEKYARIVVYTSDMDIAHVIDAKGKVSLQTPVSVSYDVERQTYEKVLSNTKAGREATEAKEKVLKTIRTTIETSLDVEYRTYQFVLDENEIVKYNSITAFKVFFGDHSDNIKPFYTDKTTSLQWYAKFRTWAKDKIPDEALSEQRTMLLFLKSIQTDLTAEELKQLIQRVKVFYPKQVDEDYTCLELKPDKAVFENVVNLIRANTVAKYMRFEIKTLTDQQVAWIKNRAAEVSNGLIEVDFDQDLTARQMQDGAKTLAAQVASQGGNVGGF